MQNNNDSKLKSRFVKEQTIDGHNLCIKPTAISTTRDLTQPSFHNILRGLRPNIKHLEKTNTQDVYLLKRNDGMSACSRNSISRIGEQGRNVVLSGKSPNSATISNDRVVIRENTNLPNIPNMSRTPDSRGHNRERLYIDRRQLKSCPVLEFEDELKLLSLQANHIERITNMEPFKKLVYLDLTENRIHQISGLDTLVQLKVLVLSKNDIRAIEKLDELINLDVLDLHANKIRKIENLEHLKQLRVLNLSNNFINETNNLEGLDSLVELNLKRNKIKFVYEIDKLPMLSRLYLSNNDILSFEDMACLASASKLIELTLEGNPFAHDLAYKQIILRSIQPIKLLDLKKISAEEKRIAVSMCKRDEERKIENTKIVDLGEKRSMAISKAKNKWENPDKTNNNLDSCAIHVENVSVGANINEENSFDEIETLPNIESQQIERIEHTPSQNELDKKSAHIGEDSYVEIEGSVLHMFGASSIDAFDRSWGMQAAGGVNAVAFNFLDFDEIAKQLYKIKIRFPNVVHLSFHNTNLCTLHQLNALANVRKLEKLTIDESGNPITKLTYFHSYAIYRLLHLGLKNINGVQVNHNEIALADKLFHIFDHNISNSIPKFRLASLIGDKKKLLLLEEDKQKDMLRRLDKQENISKAALQYNNKSSSIKTDTRSNFVDEYVDSLEKSAIEKNMNLRLLQEDWPQLLNFGVQRIVEEYLANPLTAKNLLIELENSK